MLQPNKAGQPYVRGPITPNVGSIDTTPLTTGFPGLRTGKALSQDDRINMMNSQINPNDVKPGKTYLSDVAGDLTGRYDTVVYGANNEDAWGAQQSFMSKGINGILKGTNLAATTVVGGFATVGGAVSAIFTGRLADIWDNPVMQGIDKWNEKVDQEYLPNYYTDTEKNAEWYSRDNWMTANFLFDKVIKNSGFAVGAVISGNMASKALGLAGTAIGEAAASRALAMEASQSFKSFAPLLKNTARAFSVGKNAEAAALLKGEITSIADVAERTSKMAQIAKQTNQFAKINDVGKRVGMAAYSQAGESAFEGLQTSNEFRNQLIDQYKRGNFGVAPNAEELKKIDAQTEKVGKTSFLANMALLTATEYVQLPKLMGSSYAAERQVANSLAGTVDNVVLKNGQYVAKEATTKFGKLYNKAKGVGKYIFDPKEMGQEIGQYAVQVGTQNYYNKAYQGKDANVLVDGVLYGLFGEDESGKGVGALNSKEGLEGGLIGGLTGAAMQIKGNYLMGKETKTNTAKFLEQLNSAPTYKEAFQYKLDAVNRGVALQEEQEAAILQGDELEAKDINSDMMHNYLSPRIKYGRMDMVMDDISDMRETSMTAEGLASLKQLGLANENDTAATFNARLTNFETTAKNTEQIYKSTNLIYSGEILKDKDGVPVLNAKGEQIRKYSDSSIEQMIYAASKVANYDVRIPQVSALPASQGIDVQSIVNEELTNPESTALADKLTELDINPEINTAEVKQNLKDTVELALRRKEYLKNYNDIIANPEKYQPVTPIVTDVNGNVLDEQGNVIPKETITVKVKDGKTGQVVDKKIEIGTEYLLGKVVKYDKEGNEVIQAPTLSILADNGDGTYKIKDANGIRNVSAQVLEDYQLSKLSDITSDKKKNYVYVNRNNLFSNKLIKDANGNPVVGRLEYTANKDRLIFAYKNEKGKIIRREVYNNMFKAKEGFKEAIITQVGEVTAEAAKATEEFVNAVTTISQRLQTRNNIILDLYDRSVKRLDEITKKLNNSKERTAKAIEALENQLAAESLTKAGKPRKNQTPAMKKIINELSSLQAILTKENEQLLSEKEELESNIPFFKDFLDNLETLPESGREMINLLKSDINTLEDLIDITNQAIKDNDSLLKQIEDAFLKAVSIFNDYIKRLQQDNPGVPLFIDELRTYLENILENKGIEELNNIPSDFVAKVIELESDINDFSAELKIPALNKKAEDLVKDIADLKEGLDKLISEQIAKREILDAFEQFAEDVKKQEEEAKQMQRNVTLGQELLGTLTGSVQNFFGKATYEAMAKKDELAVVAGTRPAPDTIPHQERANFFGNKMDSFENKNQLRAMIVTSATENDIMPGLTENFLQDMKEGNRKEAAKAEIIFMVMVQDNEDGSFSVVDQNGQPILEDENKIDNAVYQVFPSTDLTSTYDGVTSSMFREGTDDDLIESLTDQYKEWTADQLAQTELGDMQDFSPSFGQPRLVTYKNEKGEDIPNPGARTSAQDAGLVTQSALNKNPLLEVATSAESVSEGSVTFDTPTGRVFLRIPGRGLAKLFNRTFSDNEAKVIFDVMHQITKNALRDGEINDSSKELFDWLKSVTYWGIAKYPNGKRKENPGYNNIWFETVKEDGESVVRLFMSGLNKDSKQAFEFTPTGLQDRKDDIIMLLKSMYNNTDSAKVNGESWSTPYYEITGIDSEGNPIDREWPNYQTYLLSDKAPNANREGKLTVPRTGKELPLATQFRPITESQPINREGIYFTLDDASQRFVKPQPTVVAVQPVVAAQPVATTDTKDEFIRNGQTSNTIEDPTYGDIVFTVDKNNVVDLDLEASDAAIKELAKKKTSIGMSQEEAETWAGSNFLKAINTKLSIKTQQVAPTEQKFSFDGVTPNTIDNPLYGAIVFTVNEEGVIDLDLEESDVAITALAATKVGLEEEAAKDWAGSNFLKAINNKIALQLVQQQTPNLPPVADVAPVVETSEVVGEEEVVPEVAPEQTEGDISWDTPVKPTGRRGLWRLLPINKVDEITPENWEKVDAFIKKAMPTLPFYRVKNMIQATNGREAYGMLHDAAIYVYEGAEIGTAYHEVFEAVWKMFAGPAEKQLIIDEFKSRKGSYFDEFQGKEIEYAKATNEEIKEELAEEFRRAVLADKLGKPLASKSLIGKLFSQLIDYIKGFFTGKNALSNTKELFDKIGDGYYAQYNPYETKLSYANKGIQNIESVEGDETSDFRLKIKNIPAQQIHDIIQQMTYNTLSDLAERKKSLFEVTKPKKNELYARLKQDVLVNCILQYKAELDLDVVNKLRTQKEITPMVNNLKDLFNKIKEEWPAIVEKHEEHLKTYSIEFDENDELNLNDEDNSGKSDYMDARKIDSFRKSNSVVKLLLATLPKTAVVNGKIVQQFSTIGGVVLMPADQAFITLMNALHTSVNPNEMFNRLRTMAKSNPNYDVLYRRLTNGSPLNKPLNWEGLEQHDLQLLTAFWTSMKKQNADVVTVFILPSGEVVIGNSVLSGAARQAKREMINSIANTIRTDVSKYFHYDKRSKKYNPTPFVKSIKFNSGQLGQYVAFLQGIGIDFKLSDLEDKRKMKPEQLKMFRKAVEGIQNSFSQLENISSLTSKTLNIDKRLTQLGTVKAMLENPDFESTYFNINGERTQSFIGTNAISTFHDVISQITNLKELADSNKGFSAYKYLLTDKFSKGSVMLAKMFDLSEEGDGGRRDGTEDLMKPVFVDGTVNEQTGNKKESSKLSAKQRLIQELNLNLSGIFMNLVPGDASIEHAIKMHNDMFGNDADSFITEATFAKDKYLEIFRDYFISEVELSKDKRTVVNGKKSTDLRFFKAILEDALHNQIMSKANSKKSSEKLYADNKAKIDAAVKSFIIQEAEDTENLLRNYGVINTTAEGVETEGLPFDEEGALTQSSLENKLKVMSVNYMIANIEMHKLIYSDPYQYSDELKRIKNFNSPRQAMLYGSKEVNASLNNKYNVGYEPGDIGYTDMKIDHFVSSVMDDVFSTDELEEYLKPYEETDGGGYIILKANRVFLLRTGQWNDAKEKQYRYDVAYEKTVKGEELTEAEKEKQGLTLSDEEKAFGIKKVTDKEGEVKYVGKNPNVKSLYTPIKPIVSGNKNDGKDYNDVVLDKFALVPLSFRILHEMNPESNAIKHYNKMQRENTDYTVYGTGRKVGTGVTTPLYLPSGEYNEASFAETNNIPFSIMGLQTEVPSKDTPLVTQGSQITKLATMDFMEAGVPIDFELKDAKGNIIEDINQRFSKWITLKTEEEKAKASPLYKEIANNQKLLEAKIEQGYSTLLKKLGIVEGVDKNNKKTFSILDKSKLIRTLRDEILKREVNDNIIDALEGFKEGDVVLEATPAYQQIRNILYSIADKQVVRPKISGGMKVQISSTLFESNRIKGEEFKDKNGNTKYRYSSDLLKFYKNADGERVCEIMIARWFDNEQTKGMSDKQLLDYLNTTDEGKAILAGIGYRIPTQKQNSIDSFVIKQFLPKDFGDSVVIPSALVKKVGSDFDIDKLSIYLKNVFTDDKGKLRMVPFLGYGRQAKDQFEDMFYDILDNKIAVGNAKLLSKFQMQTIFGEVAYGKSSDAVRNKWIPIFREMFHDDLVDDKLSIDVVEESFIKKLVVLGKNIDELTDVDLQTILADEFVDEMYKKSLENAYIQSLQDLVSHPTNFDNLVKPNSSKEMEDLSKDINKEMGSPEIDYGAVGNMLNRGFMTSLRQAFVSGKYAIGIAATGQTNHADNQRAATYIDIDKLDGVDPVDKEILGGNPNSSLFAKDPNVNFEEYNSIEIDGINRPTLSMIKNKAGKYISDIIGQFIDGYVDISKGPWIMRLGATPNVTSTWLFLIKLGVPADTVGYFMNQPIVKDYLRTLENKGYTWLFNDKIMESMLDAYDSGVPLKNQPIISGIPSEKELFGMLKYNKVGMKTQMSEIQKIKQQYILKEFIKYSKMSSQLFDVVQGSNVDTATINDPYLVFKKMLQLEKARKSIISSVDNLLASSFKGVLKDRIFNVRDAFAEILISDKTNVRAVMEEVLTPYVKLSDRDFVKVSQKAVNDLFDWAVQTNRDINLNVANILLGTTGKNSAAQEIINFRDSILGNVNKGINAKPNHPLFNNIILNSIKMEAGIREGKANNLYLAGRDNKTYDQNLIIYGFEELKKGLGAENKDLYGKLVRLAVIQSGLTNSPIAFTNLLPYKDFKELYNQTLSNLENLPNLADFQTLHVFERNNWNNFTILPFVRANMKLGKPNKYDGKVNLYYVDAHFTDSNLKKAMQDGRLPKVIGISPYGDGRNDFITYSWEDPIEYGERVKRKKTGDTSHVHKVLMQKVYTKDDKGNPIPLVQVSEDGKYVKHIFKAINAWGDSYKAQEFYDYERASVLDNDYEKVERVTDAQGKQIESGEVSDDDVIRIFKNQVAEETPVTQPTETSKSSSVRTTIQMQPQNVEKILNGTKTTTIRESVPKGGNITVGQTKIVNFGGKDFNVTNRGQLTIDEAGGVEAIVKSEGLSSVDDFMYQQSKNWANGQGKMYVFDIISTETVSEKPEEVKPNKLGNLTKDEADLLMSNLKKITTKYKSNNLAESIDTELKEPIIIGDTTITNIEPSPGGESSVMFNNLSGTFMVKIKEKGNKMILKLLEYKDVNGKGEFYFYSTRESEANDLKTIENNGLLSLVTKIFEDTNIQDPGTRVGQFNVSNSLQEKYGLKRTYKDIVNELSQTISKPEDITQKEWDGLSQEEKNKIKEC